MVAPAFLCGRVLCRVLIADAVGGIIYALREVMGLTYAGGQDDVLREVDSVFYLCFVGLGIIILLQLLRR